MKCLRWNRSPRRRMERSRWISCRERRSTAGETSNMRTIIITTMFMASATVLGAQDPQRSFRPPRDTDRAQLEQEFRQRNEQMIRERLKLTDEQVKQMRAMDARFRPRRAELAKEWRETNEAMRKEVDRGDAADQKRVTQLLQQTAVLRKRSMDLMDEEVRDLGTFLTPVQTAQYVSLQAQLRANVQRKADRDRGGPPGGAGRDEGRDSGRVGKERRGAPPAQVPQNPW